jgi:hypothetical protein
MNNDYRKLAAKYAALLSPSNKIVSAYDVVRQKRMITLYCLLVYFVLKLTVSLRYHNIMNAFYMPSNKTCNRTSTQRVWLARTGVGGVIL